MKIITLLICWALLLSCATSNKKIFESDILVTGESKDFHSSDLIKMNLIKKFSMSGGNYQIETFPYTKAYIKSLSREYAQSKSLSKDNSNTLNKNLFQKFLNEKICIDANFYIKEFEQVKKLKNWSVTLIDFNNIAYKLEWLEKNKATIVSSNMSYQGSTKNWTTSGVACASAKVDIEKGFKLVFRPIFIQWPFNDEHQEEWSFNHIQVVKGKKILKKKKEPNKYKYRGW